VKLQNDIRTDLTFVKKRLCHKIYVSSIITCDLQIRIVVLHRERVFQIVTFHLVVNGTQTRSHSVENNFAVVADENC